MRIHTALALLLLLPAAASTQESPAAAFAQEPPAASSTQEPPAASSTQDLPAASSTQDLRKALSAVVRISGTTRDGARVQGSGFVVGLETGMATVVTASHVIQGVQQFEVTFAAKTTEHFPVPAGDVLGMDAGSPNGLAVFQVRGAIPAGVTTLSFEAETRPSHGDELFLVGFPQMELAPRTSRRVLSGRRGMLLLVDQGIGEGFSGGPVLQGGKVVGVVTETDDQTTYAVNAVVAREALEGWGVKLGVQSSTPVSDATTEPRPAPTDRGECVSGEVRTENGIDFVRICPGTFTMGSADNDPQAAGDERPAHQVTLSEFWIGKTEITNEQYRRFFSDHQGEAGLPATNVSWADAKAACEHFGGRLPTEAQWEYAARAGSQTTWSFGDDEKMLGEYGWYDKNSGGTPHPVGTKKPNAWGLHDMHGSYAEWLADWYSSSYPSTAQTDPPGPTAGETRVLRGGCYACEAKTLRSASRGWSWPEYREGGFSFRCVRGPRRQP